MSRRDPSPPGVRPTRQRAAIIETLKNMDGFLSAQELHDLMKPKHKIGLSTVYRNLQALAFAGEVDALRNPEGETIYRLCDSEDHHHHIVCMGCGLTVEVENVEFESWVARTARAHGFSRISHVAAVYGLCEGCTSASPGGDA